MKMPRIVECVPNFSVGRNKEVSVAECTCHAIYTSDEKGGWIIDLYYYTKV